MPRSLEHYVQVRNNDSPASFVFPYVLVSIYAVECESWPKWRAQHFKLKKSFLFSLHCRKLGVLVVMASLHSAISFWKTTTI
jgi:hypothetical protein